MKIQLEQVSVKYLSWEGETAAVENLSLSVEEGEFVSLVGPSGCGKSTLLSLIAGLLAPTSGKVLVDGQAVTGTSDKIGYMLQQDYLFEWRNIWQNVIIGLEIQGKKKEPYLSRARALINAYGLGSFTHHFPSQLSGGMRQRAALIRTLCLDPEILLLDEPFSALDYQTRLTLENEIGQILRQEKKTALLVTHDISEAVAMSDRVLVLSRRPCRIKKEFKLDLGEGHLTPLQARESPHFYRFYQEIWKELDIHV